MRNTQPSSFDQAARAVGLEPLTAALLECITPEDVATVIAERGIAVLGAEAAIVALVASSGTDLELVAARGYAPSVAGDWKRFPIDGNMPLSRAVRERAGLFVSTGAEWEALYPNLLNTRTRATKATVDLPLTDGQSVLGGLHFSFPDERDFPPAIRSVIHELGRQCSLAMSRALLRVHADRAHHRMAFLARAAQALVSSLDYESTLDNVARLAVPEFADCVQVYIAAPAGGKLKRLAAAHRDPALEPAIREIQERYPIRPESNHPVLRAMASGEPQLTAEITDEMIEAGVVDPEYRRLLLPIGLRSLLTVPMAVREAPVGAMMFLMTKDSGRRFDSSDIDFLSDLARRAAVAVDNARLYAEAQHEVAERRLRDEQLSLAIEGGQLGTWHWDMTSDRLTWSDRCRSLFGLSAGSQPKRRDIERLLHPDDRLRVRNAVRDAIESHDVYDVQYRAVWPDGTEHWIRSRGRTFCDARGVPIRFEGVMMDIDELVQAELRRNSFLRDVLYNATDGKLNLVTSRDNLPACSGPVAGPIALSEGTLYTLRRRIREHGEQLGFAPDRLSDMLTAADEAAMNAVVHAGSGTAYICGQPVGEARTLRVRIEDSGSGIAIDRLPHATLLKGYTTAGTMGFGFKLIVQAVDRVSLATGSDGTAVVLDQYQSPPTPNWLSDVPTARPL